MSLDLRIHTWDHLPVLADRLAETMARAPLPPLQAETVVVQSQGLARWLHLDLARRHGIAASLHTPFPATFLQRLAQLALPEVSRPAADPFDRGTLRWRIHRLLLEHRDHPAFTALRGYLEHEHDADQRKGLQLAARIAVCFEEYPLYRPELLRWWRGGEAGGLPFGAGRAAQHVHAGWQRILWRDLCREAEALSPPVLPLADQLQRLLTALEGADPLPDGSVPRAAVFGVSHLPPPFLDVLFALARHRPVDLYLLLPPGERQRQAHPLLDRFGRQGIELWDQLQRRDPDGSYFEDVHGDGAEPDGSSALAVLQQDLRDLVDRRVDPGDAELPVEPPLPLHAGDRSLTLHVCHSARREVEVARDQILAAFDELPDLQPSDVLILLPDVRAYAPHLLAVFDRPVGERQRALPVALSDRSLGEEQQVFTAFLQVLHTLRSRWEQGDLLTMLDGAPVRRALGLTLEDVATIQGWLSATQVRWGLDGAWRQHHFKVPPEAGHSLRRGLDRLLLGLCTGPVTDPVAGLYPHGEDTAGRAEVLGRCAEWVQRLAAADAACRGHRPLAEWVPVLTGIVDDFLAPADEGDEDGIRRLRELIAALGTQADAADHVEPLGLAALVDHFDEVIAGEGRGQGYLTGAITACALRPMRSIPFRVIAVLGLEDGAFPRADARLPFDLLAEERLPGDRSARDDDRQLFLETLLSARDRLVLSYTGYSPRDGSRRPASLCVAELMDHVDRSFTAPAGGPARAPRELLTTEHPMHGFDPRYQRDDARWFTYAHVAPTATAPFVATACPLPDAADPIGVPAGDPSAIPDQVPGDRTPLEDIAVDDLVSFWDHPQRFFCRRVLRIVTPRGEDAPPLTEPFLPDALENFQLNERALDRAVRDLPRDEAWWRAADLLAHGAPGELVRRAALHTVAPLAEARAVGEWAAIEIDLAVPQLGVRFVGAIEDVDLGRGLRMQARAAKIRAKDELRAWVQHLLLTLHAQRDGRGMPTTQVLGVDRAKTLGAVQDPVAALRPLVHGWRRGRVQPLPYFRSASPEVAKAQRKGNPALHYLADARGNWESSEPSRRGDGDDPWVRYAFRGSDPLDAVFAAWGAAVWNPYFDAQGGPGWSK